MLPALIPVAPARVFLALLTVLSSACATAPKSESAAQKNAPAWTDVQVQIGKQVDGEAEADAAQALRDLLAISIEGAAVVQAKPGGYLRNPRVRIGIPEPLLPAADALTEAGLHAMVQDFIEDMNVAAEITAGKVAPLLRSALASMTIRDAQVTLRGDDETAAMRAFRRQSEAQLLDGFEPPMRDSLRRAGGLDSFRALIEQYNKLPGAKKIPFDYELYVRERAVDGIYVAIGEQERAIRREPGKRSTALLRRMLAKP